MQTLERVLIFTNGLLIMRIPSEKLKARCIWYLRSGLLASFDVTGRQLVVLSAIDRRCSIETGQQPESRAITLEYVREQWEDFMPVKWRAWRI